MQRKLIKLDLENFRNLFFFPLISSFLLALSFPKFDLSILVFFSFIPLFWVLSEREKNTLVLFIISTVFGLTSYVFLLYWIVYTLVKYGNLHFLWAFLLLLTLSAYLSLYYFIFFYISAKIQAFSLPSFLKGIAISSFLVATEFLRSVLLTGFPWALLGYPLSHFSHLLQIADLFGIWGLSFIAMFVNYFFYFIFKKASLSTLHSKDFILNTLLFGLTIFLVVIYGAHSKVKWERLLNLEKQEIKVSLLQGNIPQELKEAKEVELSLSTYKGLTIKALQEKPHFIAFPETALPFYFPYEREPTLKFLEFLEYLKELSKNKGLNPPVIIFGAFRVSTNPSGLKVHNTLFAWDGENIGDFYDKEKLVPFGEYIPLVKVFPFLKKISVVSDILKPGISKNLMIKSKDINLKITPLICFESAFPQISIKRVREGGEVIFIATNDAWFGKTSAPYQHFQMAKVRAVESRRYVAQAANTGITGFIDPLGKTVIKSSLEIEEIITEKIKPIRAQTFFVNWGYLFPYFCLFLFILVCLVSLIPSKSHRQFGN